MAKVTGKKTLHFSRVAWEKMWGLTLRAKGEISGFGLIDENDPCRVIDFHVVTQECSSGNSTMDPDPLHELFLAKRDEGIPMERWCVWWHSHADLDTFFSGTDEATAELYASDNALWSVVTNHADAVRVANGKSPTEMYIRVDCFDPDNPKSLNSPRRYTIEGCDWTVGNVQVVPNSWFDEQIAKTRPYAIPIVKPKKYGYYPRGDSLAGWPGNKPSNHSSGWKDLNSRYPHGGHPITDHLRPARSNEEMIHDWEVEMEMARDRYEGYGGITPPGRAASYIEGDDDAEEAEALFEKEMGVDEEDDPYFSHPFIEGMYLHGLLTEEQADEISGEYEDACVTEAELIAFLESRWDLACEKYDDMDHDTYSRILDGLGPVELPTEEPTAPKEAPCST